MDANHPEWMSSHEFRWVWPEEMGITAHNSIGPEEATASNETPDYTHESRKTAPDPESWQPTLPGLALPPAHPWEQTFRQFSRDPRTWWHGRLSEHLPPDPWDDEENSADYESPSFHVGTLKAAQDRVRHLTTGGVKPAPTPEGEKRPAPRAFPVRLPNAMMNDVEDPLHEPGEWSSDHHFHFYENGMEDKGSTSAVLPGPGAVMTHRQFVEHALTRPDLSVPEHVRREHEELTKAHGGKRRDYDPEITMGVSARTQDDYLNQARRSYAQRVKPSLFSSPDPANHEDLFDHLQSVHGVLQDIRKEDVAHWLRPQPAGRHVLDAEAARTLGQRLSEYHVSLHPESRHPTDWSGSLPGELPATTFARPSFRGLPGTRTVPREDLASYQKGMAVLHTHPGATWIPQGMNPKDDWDAF